VTIDEIKNLYIKKGLSAREVGKILGLSQWSIIALMRKHKIPRRKPVETLKIQFEKKPLSFKKKLILNPPEEKLYETALMLYWAEGARAKYGIVDFANCDEKMILIFLKMLREIYQVTEKRIHVFIYCHANTNPQDLIAYWSRKLVIPRSQFSSPYVINISDGSKINKMPYGLVHIRYNDRRLHEQILKDIDIISSSLLPR